eukprot:GHVR01139410.1.p1 GENE.GHVR01139410.1~~GHVR01139410.1.p1  ORF type:complete len:376 (+),score=124.96 GHVR01139410.1:68-1195(+)
MISTHTHTHTHTDDDLSDPEEINNNDINNKNNNNNNNINIDENNEYTIDKSKLLPDEVIVPIDQKASQRYTRYRSLVSFRTSPWDPYESLPISFSRIHEFQNIKGTIKESHDTYSDWCKELPHLSGSLCVVYIQGVSPSTYGAHPINEPFILSTLLPHERKITQCHCDITHMGSIDNNNDISSINNKEVIEIHSGFRRMLICPIISECNETKQSNKHKLLLKLNNNNKGYISFISQALFPPNPVMLFKYDHIGLAQLTGWGSVLPPDTKRVIVKRIVLAGSLCRVHKRRGTVRDMFNFPSDVKYFKPVELFTTSGGRGHISEPVGTHGKFKCLFNSRISQSESICLSLYKRVYPKFYPPTWGQDVNFTPENHPDV